LLSRERVYLQKYNVISKQKNKNLVFSLAVEFPSCRRDSGDWDKSGLATHIFERLEAWKAFVKALGLACMF
jgi:hypothetical protein